MKKLFLLIFLFVGIALQAQKPFQGVTILTDTSDGGTDTILAVVPEMFHSRWIVTYQVVPTETRDSLTGTIKLQDANDPAGTVWTDLTGRSLTMTNAAITVPFLTDTVDALRHRIWYELTNDSGTGYFNTYYWARPHPNIPGLPVVKKTFSAVTMANTDTDYFTLGSPLDGQYECEWVLVTTRASGTASGTITLQESCTTQGTAWSDLAATATISNAASQQDVIKQINKGKRVRLKVVTSGTQSLSIVAYLVAKPLYY